MQRVRHVCDCASRPANRVAIRSRVMCRDRPATIEYRQGDAPDSWRPVQVEQLAAGPVEVFVRLPESQCIAAAHGLRRAIVAATLFTAVGLWAHWTVGMLVAVVTALFVYRAYARLINT